MMGSDRGLHRKAHVHNVQMDMFWATYHTTSDAEAGPKLILMTGDNYVIDCASLSREDTAPERVKGYRRGSALYNNSNNSGDQRR